MSDWNNSKLMTFLSLTTHTLIEASLVLACLGTFCKDLFGRNPRLNQLLKTPNFPAHLFTNWTQIGGSWLTLGKTTPGVVKPLPPLTTMINGMKAVLPTAQMGSTTTNLLLMALVAAIKVLRAMVVPAVASIVAKVTSSTAPHNRSS
jgi:hypothetical protein